MNRRRSFVKFAYITLLIYAMPSTLKRRSLIHRYLTFIAGLALVGIKGGGSRSR